jgi:ABC-type lipoprotein release transport system permease subunit
MAWRNLGRNRRRTALAIGAISLGQLTLVFVNCMMAGMYEDIQQTVTGPFVGHVQIQHADWREERGIELYLEDLGETVEAIHAMPEVVRVSPRILAPALVALEEEGKMAMLVGVDVEAESQHNGLLATVAPEGLPRGNSVVVGRGFARKAGIGPGDELAVMSYDTYGGPADDLFEVRAIVTSNVGLVNQQGVVMSLDAAQGLLVMEDMAHQIVVHAEEESQAEAVAARIAALPALESAEVLPWREAAPIFVTMLNMKDYMDAIFIAIVFAAAAAGIANTMMMSTFERMREFGMLLALGTRPARIVWMIVVEALVLGVIGVAIGSAVGTGLVLLTSHTGLDYSALSSATPEDFDFWGINFSYIIYPMFEARHVVFGTIAVTVTSVLAALWPSAVAARLEPARALHS